MVLQFLSQQFAMMASQVGDRAFRQVWFCSNQHGSLQSLYLPVIAGTPVFTDCYLSPYEEHCEGHTCANMSVFDPQGIYAGVK